MKKRMIIAAVVAGMVASVAAPQGAYAEDSVLDSLLAVFGLADRPTMPPEDEGRPTMPPDDEGRPDMPLDERPSIERDEERPRMPPE